MKQVSYEVATLSFLEIRNGNDDIELVKTVLDYMYQHKPPTCDEVVKSWENLGFTFHEKKFFIYLFNEQYHQAKNVEIRIFKKHLHWDFESKYNKLIVFTPELTKAINLTIRYLEAQKHHDL